MTTNALAATTLALLHDLARDIPEHERYKRLLDGAKNMLPCDAIALLRLDGQHLTPLAVDGLRPDTLGRRFGLQEHPRLAAILSHPGAIRFPADSPLPDPYDGLVEGHRGHLHVHDCMGCTLSIDDRPWGVLTLDALDPSRFDADDLELLDHFSHLAAATVKAVVRLNELARRVEDERQLAEHYRESAALPAAPELIGQSAPWRRLLNEIDIVAASDLTVLIQGETGVGKELVAQSIHARSARSRHPLITINCAALPETLVESELFGHVRGAFSGAVGERRGKFELADGGTLFLDEIGELPLPAQATLLRVLQTGQLQRVGSDAEHHVNVRVLAATNRNLAEEVRRGRFRPDLYHRISVYPLSVPPLRERGRDILLLTGYFLEQYRPRLRVRGLRLAPPAQAALLAYDWPGNVRELEHLLSRSALKALARTTDRTRVLTIELADMDLPTGSPAHAGQPGSPRPDDLAGTAPEAGEHAASAYPSAAPAAPNLPPFEGADFRTRVETYQRELIAAALRRHDDNWAAAARELGLDRANLHRLARRLGLKNRAP